MSRRLRAALLLAALAGGCAPDGDGYDGPDREARAARAEGAFRGVAFDTLTWASAAERLREGNATFLARCRNCHGPLGEGGTEYARERGLHVPPLAGSGATADPAAVRRAVFVGHAAGMPSWGLGDLSAREIDAVAAYVAERLRPDALRAR